MAAAVSVANLVFIHADDDELEDIKQRFFGLCLLDIGLLLKSWSYEMENLYWSFKVFVLTFFLPLSLNCTR